jgi:protein required for attachment to host cells
MTKWCDEPQQPLAATQRSPEHELEEKPSMPLPHNALVLVADGRKMLFFRNQGDENQIDLRTEAHEARHDRKDREIKTDAPGTNKQSAGYGRSTYEEPDFHQQEEDRWIDEAADELKARVLRGDFDALAIIAPPKALGVLRKKLHKEVEKRIVCTVNKEMSGRPIPDIEALLDGYTAAEELPPV